MQAWRDHCQPLLCKLTAMFQNGPGISLHSVHWHWMHTFCAKDKIANHSSVLGQFGIANQNALPFYFSMGSKTQSRGITQSTQTICNSPCNHHLLWLITFTPNSFVSALMGKMKKLGSWHGAPQTVLVLPWMCQCQWWHQDKSKSQIHNQVPCQMLSDTHPTITTHNHPPAHPLRETLMGENPSQRMGKLKLKDRPGSTGRTFATKFKRFTIGCTRLLQGVLFDCCCLLP